MEESNIRSESEYLRQATWDELYILTGHWKSNLDFHKDEILFLKNLIGKYFIWITKESSLPVVRKMNNQLFKLHMRQEDLVYRLKKHLTRLELLMENAFSQDEAKSREEHSKLEDQLARFTKDFRNQKKEIFTLTEHVLDSERFQRMLPAAAIND
jgi:hypothetical protein